jgi:endonuclease-3 related protein
MAKNPVIESVRDLLEEIYRRLFEAYGPQHWWPGDGPFEVMVGAVLTQSVAWRNVETAVKALEDAGALNPAALREIDADYLAGLVRPTIYYNVKARKLKALARYLGETCGDNLQKLFDKDTRQLREELLGVWGIGEETADSILLYAAYKPVFVIDAYTRRIIDRVGIQPEKNDYQDYQALFMNNLDPDTAKFNEYHALLVRHGKEVCRTKPLCAGCPLRDICRTGNTA